MRLIDAEGSKLQTQLKLIREAEYQIYGSGSWGFAAKCEHAIEDAPTIQPEPDIIYCKDCRKHNKKVGFDENFHTVWKEDACPLASWRGKAQGHEFDYQFCAYGERRTE